MSVLDKMLRVAGRTKDGVARALRVNDEGRLQVDAQLTGSNDEYEMPVILKGDNVELIKSYFNAKVITDDGMHFSEEVSKESLSKYSALFFKVICSFRQEVRIYLYDGGTGFSEKGFIPITSAIGLRLITENEHKILVTPGSVRLRLSIKAMTPPEEGTITVELYGKKMTGGVGNAETDTRSS